jgi:hypothetical protein
MKPIRLPFWQFSRDDVCPTEHVLAEGVSDTASPVGPGRENLRPGPPLLSSDLLNVCNSLRDGRFTDGSVGCRADDAGNHWSAVYSNTRPNFQIIGPCDGIYRMNHAQAKHSNSEHDRTVVREFPPARSVKIRKPRPEVEFRPGL